MIKSSYLRSLIRIRIVSFYAKSGKDFSKLSKEQATYVEDNCFKAVYDYATEKGISINEAIQIVLPR